MHCVHIAYPRIEGAEFDLDHCVNVHMPIGLGLLWRHFEIKPDRVFLQQRTYGADRTAASAAYDVVGTMVFSRKEDADHFIDLFETPEAVATISADWPKFTKAEPIAVLGELRELDPQELVDRSAEVLATTEATLAGWNPLAPEELAWPYHTFARARDEQPVFYNAILDAWVVTRYEDLVTVSKRTDVFSSRDALYTGPIPKEAAPLLPKGYPWDHPTLVNCDPPAHTRIRKLANQAFKPSAIAAREPEVREIVDRLIDRFASEGEADLIERFAAPLPALTICKLLDVPEQDASRLAGWADDMSTMFDPHLPDEERIERSKRSADFYAYCEAFIDDRRDNPRDDLMSNLIEARSGEVEGEPALTQEELISIFTHLQIGGNETTRRLVSTAVLRLLEHPEQLARLLDDPALIERGIEETLRHTSPNKGLFRRTTCETKLGGTTIPKGALVAVMWASGNHDEGHFDDPARFDIGRENAAKHLAFGRGAHFCIGAPLARLEGRVALERLLDRLPNLRRADDRELVWSPNPFAQGLESLRVAWDVARS